MENENPIRTLGDYSRPSREGYRNTIELLNGNNVVPLRSDTIWVSLSLKHGLILMTYCKKSLMMTSIFGSKSNSFMTMSTPPQGEPSISQLLAKAISLPQDVPSTSDRHLVELENQVQCLMEAHLDPKSLVQMNKIASSCEICSAGTGLGGERSMIDVDSGGTEEDA
nr:zinc finger, CCHC-type [Tanacetum cinerariifolium]